jgi:hypothetical protein
MIQNIIPLNELFYNLPLFIQLILKHFLVVFIKIIQFIKNYFFFNQVILCWTNFVPKILFKVKFYLRLNYHY